VGLLLLLVLFLLLLLLVLLLLLLSCSPGPFTLLGATLPLTPASVPNGNGGGTSMDLLKIDEHVR
jgi:hypothetical protein